jgi:Zn finger protein HypA/HybF involved in hydrogenase expression
MADPVPSGSDVSSGTYKCTKCGYELSVQSTKHLPPCAKCGNGHYNALTGGDSVNDPYPGR